jgi:hypothetical protein
MPKKRVQPKSKKKREVISLNKYYELQEKLIENNIELQKVNTMMAQKFDSLTIQISTLLDLFETSAKTFASNPVNQLPEKDTDLLEKLDKLLDQNKVIARGLTLMEERVRERMYGFQKYQPPQSSSKSEEVPAPSINSRPLPKA